MDLAWSGEQKRAAKELFGRPLRVVLAHWILERQGEPFFLQEAQDAMRALGEAPSGVAKEIRVFAGQGMLTVTPDGRRIYFTPVRNPFWQVFTAASRALGLASSGQAWQTESLGDAGT